VADLPKIGGTKNPDLDAILRLEPELVLVNSEENRRQDITWLDERFEVYETMPSTVFEVADVLRGLGERLDCWDEAESFILEIQAQLTRIEVESFGRRRLRVFMPIWKDPWMSFNGDTYMHHLLAAVGCDNVCAGLGERYPALSEELIAELEPDLVLLPSEPYEFGLADQTALLRSGWFGGRPVRLVDGRSYSWHGSMTGRSIGVVHDFILGHRKHAVLEG
jgi:ABC-type Fe3+-hydroxamate transport system substrate-binding protein